MLRDLRKHVAPVKGGMTERNRARLRPFDDPVNVERLVNLPEELARAVARNERPSYSDAIQIQSAVAIALELVAPLRAKNLAGLTLERHFVPARSGPGAVVHLVVPAGEIKNQVSLEFELPPDVVRLVDLYVVRFRPLLMTDRSSCLFPARRGGAKAPAHLGAQVQRAIKRTTGLTLNIHAFRHLCAFLFLKANPGEYETVRLLLGHKSLTTTVRNYCGLEQSDAFRRYDKLLDQYRRPEELRRAG
jgi:integrase